MSTMTQLTKTSFKTIIINRPVFKLHRINVNVLYLLSLLAVLYAQC